MIFPVMVKMVYLTIMIIDGRLCKKIQYYLVPKCCVVTLDLAAQRPDVYRSAVGALQQVKALRRRIMDAYKIRR